MNLDERLRLDGFVVLRNVEGRGAVEQIFATFGRVVHRTSVELRLDVRTYLCSTDAVPFHTDHPNVDIVAWRCERQDDVDGASLLVDAHAVLAKLDSTTRAALRDVDLPCPDLRMVTTTPAGSRPLLSNRNDVYFADWLEHPAPAWRAFRQGVETEPATTVRLTAGEVLLVDNHRMLHGRRGLGRASLRRLERTWLIRSRPEVVATP